MDAQLLQVAFQLVPGVWNELEPDAEIA